MDKISPSKVLFIKLGSSGAWEEECIEKEQTLRIGFDEFEHDDCIAGKWDAVRAYYKSIGTSPQWITTYINQLQYFYEAGQDTLWITFYKQKMWWCFATKKFIGKGKELKLRKVQGKWQSTDINGKDLLVENLSGELLQTQGYQSTICEVKAANYAVKKINGEELPEVLKVKEDVQSLRNSLSFLVKKLTPKDFEVLVDLIFRNAGCQRVSTIGGPQKTKDIELLAPVTGERYLVQIKSRSSLAQFIEYKKYFEEMEGYDKYYYVVHSPDNDLERYRTDNGKIIIWKMHEITDFCINSGLINWVVNKVG